MAVRLTKALTVSSKVASSVLSSSSDTCSPSGLTTSSERRMESRKQGRRMRLSPIPRHCVPIPEGGGGRRQPRPPPPPPPAGRARPRLTGADEPERALPGGHLLHLLPAALAAQHGAAPEGHGGDGRGRDVVEHAHEGQVLAVPAALLQQPLHGLGGAPAGQQEAGQGGVGGGCGRRAPVGPEDDVDVGAAEAEGVHGHVTPADGQGPVHHPQPPVLQRRDLGVRAVEVQVGRPEPVLQGQQHLWAACD